MDDESDPSNDMRDCPESQNSADDGDSENDYQWSMNSFIDDTDALLTLLSTYWRHSISNQDSLSDMEIEHQNSNGEEIVPLSTKTGTIHNK